MRLKFPAPHSSHRVAHEQAAQSSLRDLDVQHAAVWADQHLAADVTVGAPISVARGQRGSIRTIGTASGKLSPYNFPRMFASELLDARDDRFTVQKPAGHQAPSPYFVTINGAYG